MECPFCKKEMKVGSIQVGRELLSWSPKGEYPKILGIKSKNGIYLGEKSIMGCEVVAYYCLDCQKCIIDNSK